ncbi:hypothetical protein GCM10010466_39600 [Planomonospora alba]|uniref:Uncharacterized protein n=1 Tax=Planomonospora alba TaxID=161354 RepID=A0ABP6NE95_9ACTN
MATIGEANAINTLLRYFLSPAGIPAENAREAAEFLAERARKALQTGIPPEELRAWWQARENTAYIEGADGYPGLRCSTCHTYLCLVEAREGLAGLNAVVDAHICPKENDR